MAACKSDEPTYQARLGAVNERAGYEHFPKKKIILVMDNLNTHKLSSLYATFEPSEARRIADRLEIHYTPKHGSGLGMAEIEIGGIESAMFQSEDS
jgi:hypothetical protein